MIPKQYNPNKKLIKALLILKGIEKYEDLAKQFGITKKYLELIINGHRKGVKYRKKIAEFLGVAYEAIWLEPEPKSITPPSPIISGNSLPKKEGNNQCQSQKKD